MAIHYKLKDNASYRNIEFYYNTEFFGPWYAWILPNDKYVSIGTGCDPKYMPIQKLKTNFEKWLKKKNIIVTNAVYEAHSLNYDYQGIEFGNIFLAGDAAGLINSFTGEGIIPAMISGEEIGKKIIDPGYKINLAGVMKKKNSQDSIARILLFSGIFRGLLLRLIIKMADIGFLRAKLLEIFT